MRWVNIIFPLFLILNNLIYAQEPSLPEELAKEQGRIKKEMEEIEKRELELLKEMDPEAYEKRLQLINRNKKIDEVISLYNKKEISESYARSHLLPLVTEEVNEQLGSIDVQIERLEKRLNYLKRIKNNPSELIEKKINRYLRKIPPEGLIEEDLIW